MGYVKEWSGILNELFGGMFFEAKMNFVEDEDFSLERYFAKEYFFEKDAVMKAEDKEEKSSKAGFEDVEIRKLMGELWAEERDNIPVFAGNIGEENRFLSKVEEFYNDQVKCFDNGEESFLKKLGYEKEFGEKISDIEKEEMKGQNLLEKVFGEEVYEKSDEISRFVEERIFGDDIERTQFIENYDMKTEEEKESFDFREKGFIKEISVFLERLQTEDVDGFFERLQAKEETDEQYVSYRYENVMGFDLPDDYEKMLSEDKSYLEGNMEREKRDSIENSYEQRGKLMRVGKKKEMILDFDKGRSGMVVPEVKIEMVNNNSINREFDIDETIDLLGERLREMMVKGADGFYL